jgi:hypothetical protein
VVAHDRTTIGNRHWHQLDFFDHGELVLELVCRLDGPRGTHAVSFLVRGKHGDDWVACEVDPCVADRDLQTVACELLERALTIARAHLAPF